MIFKSLISSVMVIIIFISFIHTGLWFSVFLLFAALFENDIKLISIFLFVLYLLVAQPLKDWSLVYFLGKKKEKWKLKEFHFLSGLDNTSDVAGSFPIIKSTLRELKLAHVDLHFLVSKPYQFRIFSERIARTHPIDGFKNEELEAYIQNDPWGKNVVEYPQVLRDYLKKKRIYCIIPISFRSMMLGFFAFSRPLEKQQIQTFEYVARRLSLIMHNQLLDDEINLSREVEKSFLIARKIEFFLEFRDHINILNYEVEKIKQGWQDKYFPVYYELKSKKVTNPRQTPKSYIILCRPNRNLQKGAIINLCLIQGYFVSFCESSSNLIKLSNRLQAVINKFGDEKIYLEGFMALLERRTVRVQYFGKHLEITKDSKKLPLKDSPPLGSQAWEVLNITNIDFDQEIRFSIRNYPLLSIQRSMHEKTNDHLLKKDSPKLPQQFERKVKVNI